MDAPVRPEQALYIDIHPEPHGGIRENQHAGVRLKGDGMQPVAGLRDGLCASAEKRIGPADGTHDQRASVELQSSPAGELAASGVLG